MPIDLFHLLIAFALAGLMGYAIQRGGTCTVLAVNEVLEYKRGYRFMALMEASLWVLGGLLIFWSLKMTTQPLVTWDITWTTVLGAFLLGVGAVINGACLVGTISRIGNFEWMFVFTLPGFLIGAMTFYGLSLDLHLPAHKRYEGFDLIPYWAVLLIIAGMLIRLYGLRRNIWQLRMATIIIAIASLILALVYGPWAFSDFLIDLAKKNAVVDFLPRLFLFVALLLGAIWGGLTSRAPKPNREINLVGVLKRFVGGALMGIGSVMIPGSHDSLILFYLPLLLPYAWVAFTVMIATIAILRFWIHRQSKMSV